MEEYSELYELDPQKKYFIVVKNVPLDRLQVLKSWQDIKIPVILLDENQSIDMFQIFLDGWMRTNKLSPKATDVLKKLFPK
jgi:hypothetical protein